MAEHHVRVNLLSSAVAIGLCAAASLVISTTVAGRSVRETFKEVKKQDQTITVRGSSKQRITSDLAVWRVRVRAENPELSDAYRSLETSAARVDEFLKKQGFKPDQIERSAVGTESHYARDEKGYVTRKVDAFELGQMITITSPDCTRVAAAAREVTGLIKDGVQVVSSAPQFTYSKLAELRVSILGEAAKDARSRADEIARNSGCAIGEVRGASTGIIQVVEPNSTDVSGGGQYDTTTIEKDATVVVNITFAVVSN